MRAAGTQEGFQPPGVIERDGVPHGRPSGESRAPAGHLAEAVKHAEVPDALEDVEVTEDRAECCVHEGERLAVEPDSRAKLVLDAPELSSQTGPRSLEGLGVGWANNPVMIALVDALSCFDVPRENVRILSLGCGDDPYVVDEPKIARGGLLA